MHTSHRYRRSVRGACACAWRRASGFFCRARSPATTPLHLPRPAAQRQHAYAARVDVAELDKLPRVRATRPDPRTNTTTTTNNRDALACTVSYGAPDDAFEFTVSVPRRYPFMPPTWRWRRKAHHHRCLGPDGAVSTDSLTYWTPASSLANVLLDIFPELCEAGGAERVTAQLSELQVCGAPNPTFVLRRARPPRPAPLPAG